MKRKLNNGAASAETKDNSRLAVSVIQIVKLYRDDEK